MSREQVLFRLIRMPCCQHQLCWVNPRLPSYCPECGTAVYMRLKFETGHIIVSNDHAWLELKEDK